MKNKNGVSKKTLVSCIIIVLLSIALVCGAVYIQINQSEEIIEEDLVGGSVSLTYSDEENLFLIENAIPMSDLFGTKLDSAEFFFDFTVKTEIEDANYVEYDIILVKNDTVSTSLNENVKVYLEKEQSGTYVKVIDPTIFNVNVSDNKIGKDAMSVYRQKKTKSGNDNYRLRLWISDTAVFNSDELQNFGVSVFVTGIAQ